MNFKKFKDQINLIDDLVSNDKDKEELLDELVKKRGLGAGGLKTALSTIEARQSIVLKEAIGDLKEKGYSIEKIALNCNVSVATVYGWVNKDRVPQNALAQKFCDFYNSVFI